MKDENEIQVSNNLKEENTTLSTTSQLEMIEQIAKGNITSVEELASHFSLPITTAISIMSDPRTINAVQKITQAKTNLFFHTKGVNRLIEMVEDTDDDKLSLSALKLIAQISNNLKQSSSDVNVNINLESLLHEDENRKKVEGPIIDIDKL